MTPPSKTIVAGEAKPRARAAPTASAGLCRVRSRGWCGRSLSYRIRSEATRGDRRRHDRPARRHWRWRP